MTVVYRLPSAFRLTYRLSTGAVSRHGGWVVSSPVNFRFLCVTLEEPASVGIQMLCWQTSQGGIPQLHTSGLYLEPVINGPRFHVGQRSPL